MVAGFGGALLSLGRVRYSGGPELTRQLNSKTSPQRIFTIRAIRQLHISYINLIMSSKSIAQYPIGTDHYNITLITTRLFDLYVPSYLTPQITTQKDMIGAPVTAGEGSNDQNILYLAYGSNLDSGTFQGKRGIKPVSATVVTVPTLTLVFDLPGIAYLEPCFANVRAIGEGKQKREKPLAGTRLEDMEATIFLSKLKNRNYRDTSDIDEDSDEDAPPLVGVVYEVTPKDYATIIATEGGGASYADVLVECIPVSESPEPKPFKAHTLLAPVTKTRKGNAQPSARYLGIITSGAAQHNFPESYRNYLARFKPYQITTVKQKIGRVLFVGMWAPIIVTILGIARLIKGPQPGWITKMTSTIFRTMWWCYDTGFKPYFGDGERTIGEKRVVEMYDKRESESGGVQKVDDMFVSLMGGETNMESSITSLSAGWDKL